MNTFGNSSNDTNSIKTTARLEGPTVDDDDLGEHSDTSPMQGRQQNHNMIKKDSQDLFNADKNSFLNQKTDSLLEHLIANEQLSDEDKKDDSFKRFYQTTSEDGINKLKDKLVDDASGYSFESNKNTTSSNVKLK